MASFHNAKGKRTQLNFSFHKRLNKPDTLILENSLLVQSFHFIKMLLWESSLFKCNEMLMNTKSDNIKFGSDLNINKIK